MQGMRKGWFDIPGEQEGARTLTEQMFGLEPAFESCAGKDVLDLGCAEGLIAREFVARGARTAVGIDNNEGFVVQARGLMDGHPRLRFAFRDLNDLDDDFVDVYSADIVLCLAILHKLRLPGRSLALAARMARERLVIRLAAGSTGHIRHKHGDGACDSREVMPPLGFRLECELPGPRGEQVQHWVRGK